MFLRSPFHRSIGRSEIARSEIGLPAIGRRANLRVNARQPAPSHCNQASRPAPAPAAKSNAVSIPLPAFNSLSNVGAKAGVPKAAAGRSVGRLPTIGGPNHLKLLFVENSQSAAGGDALNGPPARVDLQVTPRLVAAFVPPPFSQYRSNTASTRSNTFPSRAERRSLRYSAWAQASGMAEPAGCPGCKLVSAR